MAVINNNLINKISKINKKDINNCLIYCLLCGLILLVLNSVAADASVIASNSCASVKARFAIRGFAVSEFPVDPVEVGHLRICKAERGRSCCTEMIESKLATYTRHSLDTSIRTSLSRLITLLETRATRFDEFFRTLLSKSKQDFHEMFKRTYGTIYLQNSDVFSILFEELEKYYTKGQVDLIETMDTFFISLYQRIFAVLNSAYVFDDKYLECVSNHMKELKPFGDVPHKLSAQVKRSFVATRTYGRALATGVEIVKAMLSIKHSTECVNAVVSMQYCDACAGFTTVKACPNFCINVMKGCYAYQADLETEWNNYVDAMDKVGERLIGPFNIEMVVEPINIKISDAIMNFQERGTNISQRVFQGCGKPNQARRKRDIYTFPRRIERRDTAAAAAAAVSGSQDQDFFVETTGEPLVNDEDSIDRNKRRSGMELSLEHYSFNNEKNDDDVVIEEETSSNDPDIIMLDALVKDIKRNVNETKYFWRHLPYQYCNNDEIAEVPTKSAHCWNGTDVSRYLPQVVGDGISAQHINPSIKVEAKASSTLNEQVYRLKIINNKLKMAYNGLDVDWIDHEEATLYGSGSGSGDDSTEPDQDGSGDSISNTNDYQPNNVPDVIKPSINNSDNNNGGGSDDDLTNEIDNRSTTVGAAYRPQMTLTRALITYLFPIVVVWFGGIVTDVL